MQNKLKIGFIGCGHIATAHINAYLKQTDVEIVAGADIVPGKAEKFFSDSGVPGVKCYTDFNEMLRCEKLDAVSVCTYNTSHAECTVGALRAGVNVLLEKPMSVTLEEAKEIVKAEKESGLVLSIGFQPRFDPNFQKLREIVSSGRLGEVYYIQTGGGRRRGIPNSTFIEKKTAGFGCLGDIGCYSLDLVLYAIGYPRPLTVSAYKSDFFGKSTEYSLPENASRFDVDDFAAAFIRLEGGIILDFRIAWAMHLDTPGDTIILGKKAGIRIPSTECWNYGPGGAMTIYTDKNGERVEEVIPYIEQTEKHSLFENKVRSFIDAVKNHTSAPVPSEEIIINQAILDGILRSAELGREIEIKL